MFVTLKNYWNGTTNDSWTLSNPVTEQDAKSKGYQFIQNEGICYSTQVPGTVPLNMYFAPSMNDHCVTIRNLPTIDARYQYIRCEGYVFPTAAPGTIPMIRCWRADRQDTQCSTKLTHVQANGYQVHAQAEYYVFPATNNAFMAPGAGVLSLKNYWNGTTNDSWTLANPITEQDAKSKGYQFIQNEGKVFTHQVPGTVPLNMYFAPSMNDHCITVRNLPTIDARYQYIRCEGYVYPSAAPGTQPMIRCWRADRQDTQCSTKLSHVQANGYQVHAQAEYHVLM